jgi:hypothetical protein
MSHIFISYVHENLQQVERLCRDLREYGLEYWRDREHIMPGVPWKDAIRRKIQKGAFFVACFSREYTKRTSTYMNEELALAVEELRKRPAHVAWFIPVLFTKGSLPEREIGGGRTLHDLQWVDLSQDWEVGMRRIVAAVYKICPEDIDEKLAGGAMRDGERDLIQLLLKDFSLSRSGKGASLGVSFGINTKKITNRDRKDVIKATIPRFRQAACRLQERLDGFLIENRGPGLEIEERDFKFRYASGGVLPILRRGGRDYYCLFYREVDPIGWNIANGSTNTLVELLNPLEAANRELCEELLIVNPENKIRYVFADDSGKLPACPEFAVARQIWNEFFPELDFPGFEEVEKRLKWDDGPDELRISTEFGGSRTISPCYLNINALDFGIEVDRIVHVDLDEGDRLCDGEIIDGSLLNRVVGLFEVEEMNQKMRSGETSFRPQLVFHSGVDRSSDPLESVIKEFIKHVRSTGIRTKAKLDYFKRTPVKKRYDLCPVTRRIIQRYAGSVPWPTGQGPL